METWLVDSEAFRHMTGSQKSLAGLTGENPRLQVELGDNTKYVVKRVGTISFQLKSGKLLKMSEVLYVLGPKKNLLSIFSTEDRGYAIAFVDG
jgi:hypothetical protein